MVAPKSPPPVAGADPNEKADCDAGAPKPVAPKAGVDDAPKPDVVAPKAGVAPNAGVEAGAPNAGVEAGLAPNEKPPKPDAEEAGAPNAGVEAAAPKRPPPAGAAAGAGVPKLKAPPVEAAGVPKPNPDAAGVDAAAPNPPANSEARPVAQGRNLSHRPSFREAQYKHPECVECSRRPSSPQQTQLDEAKRARVDKRSFTGCLRTVAAGFAQSAHARIAGIACSDYGGLIIAKQEETTDKQRKLKQKGCVERGTAQRCNQSSLSQRRFIPDKSTHRTQALTPRREPFH